jgi:hypothetical protein
MATIYDAIVIDMEVGGVFARHRLATKYKDMKVLVIEASKLNSQER